MPSFSVSDLISAPPQTVFRFLGDVAKWPEILDTVNDVEALDGPELKIGRRYRVRQPGLQPLVWHVTHHDPPRRFTWKAASPGLQFEADHLVEATGEGQSRLTLSFVFKGPLKHVMALLFGAKTKQLLLTELATMKKQAETADDTPLQSAASSLS